jgi:hypothetical protein
MAGAFQRQALRKAAEALGGEVHLRRFLEVPSTDLYRWLRSQAPVPDPIVRKVVNLLADIESGMHDSSFKLGASQSCASSAGTCNGAAGSTGASTLSASPPK